MLSKKGLNKIMTKIKKVWIDPGCISCGSCEFIAPEVFQVLEKSEVKNNCNPEEFSDLIEQAAAACPVWVIKYKKES